jgi:alpha-1,2-mannosyltransferase
VLHAWLYRRGRDVWAGASLALAVCFKLTPGLFVLYWLYQRNWKLLAGAAGAGLIFGVVLPATLLGPDRAFELTSTWTQNMILPAVQKGEPYPEHINQSLSGVVSRYLLDGQPGGDIYWGPDSNVYADQVQHGWIGFASLEPETVRMILRIAQLLFLGTWAWAVGWKKRPRDDARRGLHYAMILTAMLLLNQRTWDHHAAPILLGVIAIWYAISFGRFPRRARKLALTLTLLAGACLWLSAGELLVIYGRIGGLSKHDAEAWSEVAAAYGPRMYCFLLLFISAAVLSISMKRSDPPYSNHRQTLATEFTQA